jgi:hypothetical protein
MLDVVSGQSGPKQGEIMPDASITALQFKIKCGQVLNTTINGAVVRIECESGDVVTAGGSGSGDDSDLEYPSGSGAILPPSGGGAILAEVSFVSPVESTIPLLDMTRLVTAFNSHDLENHGESLEGLDYSPRVLLEGSEGSFLSLDSLLIRPDD